MTVQNGLPMCAKPKCTITTLNTHKSFLSAQYPFDINNTAPKFKKISYVALILRYDITSMVKSHIFTVK